MAEKRSEVPWVGDGEKLLRGQARAGKAEPEGEIWAEGHFSGDPQGTGITAPTPEVLQAERQAMAGSACVYVCSFARKWSMDHVGF